jgi:hypothetical protein
MRSVLILTVLLVAVRAAVPTGASAAAAQCNRRAAVLSPKTQLLDYADEHSDFYADYGGADELHYFIGQVSCANLDGAPGNEMIVQLLCCTGGSPTPWGIFARDATGAWQVQYARAADNVWRVSVEGRSVTARQPAAYMGACTDHFKDREVRYDRVGHAYRSKLTPTYVRRADPSCYP